MIIIDRLLSEATQTTPSAIEYEPATGSCPTIGGKPLRHQLTVRSVRVWARQAGATLLSYVDVPDDVQIPGDSMVSLECTAQHTYVWRAADMNNGHCPICIRLCVIRGVDPLARYVDTWLTTPRFECRLGHRYLDNRRADECPVCHLLIALAGANSGLVVLGGTYINDMTRLRFRCILPRRRRIYKKTMPPPQPDPITGQRHGPCNREFYLTAQAALASVTARPESTLKCSTHMYVAPAEAPIVAALRLFEAAFQRRFDDPTYVYGVTVTGYNATLGIAFTHHADDAAMQSLSRSIIWCQTECIRHVLVEPPATDDQMLRQLRATFGIDVGVVRVALASLVRRRQPAPPAL